MKSSYVKMLILESTLLILFLLNFILLTKTPYIVMLIELLAIFILFKYIIGIDKKIDRNRKDMQLLIIICCISYYVFTNLIGFFSGFVYTSYSTRLAGIIQNIIFSLAAIYLVESLREIIIKKGKYYKSVIIISIFIFSLIELSLKINISSLHSKEDIVRMILSLYIPSITKNIILTYITYKTDKINSITYQILMTIPQYFVPVFPNLGDYMTITILCLHPFITLYVLMRELYKKREKIINTKNYSKSKTIHQAIVASLLVLIVLNIYLISNIGRYTLLSIASNSMRGTFSKGDAILLDKKNDKYKKGDVIAFKQNEIIIVHRITKVEKRNNRIKYHTQGDLNNGEDAWLVDEAEVMGKYIFRLPLLGWPTISVSEFIAN